MRRIIVTLASAALAASSVVMLVACEAPVDAAVALGPNDVPDYDGGVEASTLELAFEREASDGSPTPDSLVAVPKFKFVADITQSAIGCYIQRDSSGVEEVRHALSLRGQTDAGLQASLTIAYTDSGVTYASGIVPQSACVRPFDVAKDSPFLARSSWTSDSDRWEIEFMLYTSPSIVLRAASPAKRDCEEELTLSMLSFSPNYFGGFDAVLKGCVQDPAGVDPTRVRYRVKGAGPLALGGTLGQSGRQPPPSPPSTQTCAGEPPCAYGGVAPGYSCPGAMRACANPAKSCCPPETPYLSTAQKCYANLEDAREASGCVCPAWCR